MTPKLTVPLLPVPEPNWYLNPRKLMSSKQWEDVRHKTYARYSFTCIKCKRDFWDSSFIEGPKDGWRFSGGGRQGLHAHENWEFDDVNLIQKLVDIMAICPECHNLYHIFLTQKRILEGEFTQNEIISHFCSVNQSSTETFEIEFKIAMKMYEWRSKQNWVVDFGPFLVLVEEHNYEFIKKGKLTGLMTPQMKEKIGDIDERYPSDEVKEWEIKMRKMEIEKLDQEIQDIRKSL